MSVSSSLTDALVPLGREHTPALAERWAQTEEWLADRGEASLLEPLIEGLAELARDARGAGRDLYLLLWL